MRGIEHKDAEERSNLKVVSLSSMYSLCIKISLEMGLSLSQYSVVGLDNAARLSFLVSEAKQRKYTIKHYTIYSTVIIFQEVPSVTLLRYCF